MIVRVLGQHEVPSNYIPSPPPHANFSHCCTGEGGRRSSATMGKLAPYFGLPWGRGTKILCRQKNLCLWKYSIGSTPLKIWNSVYWSLPFINRRWSLCLSWSLYLDCLDQLYQIETHDSPFFSCILTISVWSMLGSTQWQSSRSLTVQS